MKQIIIVLHFGEIALKGKNRGLFERRLHENIVLALKSVLPQPEVKRLDARFIVLLPERAADRLDPVVRRLQEIPGIIYFGIGLRVDKQIDRITDAALELYKDVPSGSFRVQVKRSDKSFGYTSPEVGRIVGGAVAGRFDSPVDLNNPDTTIYVEISYHAALVYAKRYRAMGGIPSGMSGSVTALLSAGFDSPVASYWMMKRGARVHFVHFHSYPYISRSSIDQVRKLVRRLTDFQLRSKCYIIPIAELQKQIIMVSPQQLRVLLYRRLMMRLAGRIAERTKSEALVTGESLGQVASQTLRNIRIIDEAATYPVLRPLIGVDKEEIIRIAREIETYGISEQPYDDCCSFLMPRQAETWGSMSEVLNAESQLDLTSGMDEAMDHAEYYQIDFEQITREAAV